MAPDLHPIHCGVIGLFLTLTDIYPQFINPNSTNYHAEYFNLAPGAWGFGD